MAIERGMPAVPRGLSRELTFYLQSMQELVAAMAGLGRGTANKRAIRVGEASRYTSERIVEERPGRESITADMLATGVVTERSLANGSVTGAKLAPSAVGSPALAPDAVDSASIKDSAITEEKLSAGCVSREKLADGAVGRSKLDPALFPVFETGEAGHEETVPLGAWAERPLVTITGADVPVGSCGELCLGLDNLREENGEWLFEARAVFVMGDEVETRYPGKLHWLAMGRRT